MASPVDDQIKSTSTKPAPVPTSVAATRPKNTPDPGVPLLGSPPQARAAPYPMTECALNPSDSGFVAPSISGLFVGLPGVCTNL